MQRQKGFLALFLLLLGAFVIGYFWYVRGFALGRHLSRLPGLGRLRESPASALPLTVTSVRWESRAAMPSARTEVGVGVAAGKIYVVGGLDGLGRTVSTVEAYDPAADRWESVAPLSEGVHHAGVAGIGNALYVVGGLSGLRFQPTDKVFVYDARRRQWAKKASLPQPRGALVAVASAGRIHALGGKDARGNSARHDVYDPVTDAWKALAPLPTPRDHLAGGVVGGKLYVAGGRKNSLSRNLSILEIYDPKTDRWERGPFMPTARGGIAGAVLGEVFFVFGGEELLGTFAQVEGFNVKQNRWDLYPALPTARHGLGAATVSSTVFVLGGGRHPGLSVSAANEALMRR